jgi:hypothetical protein
MCDGGNGMRLFEKLKAHNPQLSPRQVRLRSPMMFVLALGLNGTYWIAASVAPDQLQTLMNVMFGWVVFWIAPAVMIGFGVQMLVTGKLPKGKGSAQPPSSR